jgi:hypothetical protein
MFLGELENPVSTKMISKVLRDTFEFELSKNELTESKAKFILEDVLAQISDFRNTDQYFLGERNGVYLSMLATAKYLSEYLREKKPLLEKNPPRQKKAVDPTAKAAMYQNGIQKGIGHGVNTATKFAPHVAGSAIGAFVGGLKGQSLASEHGQVKITDLEKELEMIDPRNPASVNKFFGKQMQEHFSDYKDPNSRRAISDYMNKVYRLGLAGKPLSYKDIEASLVALPGNPFKAVTDPKLRKELVNYFLNIHNSAKASATKKVPVNVVAKQPDTATMNDVVSALQNLGYPRKNAIEAVKQVVDKTPDLKGNFEGMLRGAQALVRK